jgi:glycosyltransferase involved in cell wall biosynthesis
MIRASGATLRVLKRRGHFDMTRFIALAHYLRQDRPDIIHSILFLGNGYAWPARFLARVPRLVTTARNCHEIGQLRGWVNRLAFQMSDAVICNGEAVRAYIVEHYHARPEKVVVIYNGIDLSRNSAPIANHRAAASQSSGGKRVIAVGRLVPQKDLDLFLEAAALLARATADVRFLIVGDGPCRRTLEHTAAQRGLGSKVAFLGERADVIQLIDGSDVLWLTSAWEGFPNVLLEAMACVKPVIARDVGACREIIRHGVTGYLVPGRDPQEFARHTQILFSHPDRAKEMGQAGREFVEETFSLRKMVSATANVYDTLLRA